MDVYNVVIQCPNTGKATRTGCELDDIADFRFIGLQPQPSVCEHCHETHIWTRRDAWVERQNASGVHVRAAVAKQTP